MKIEEAPELIEKLKHRIEELEQVLVDLRYGVFQTVDQVNDLIDKALENILKGE